MLKLTWWKHSFERLNEEYDMAKRKKQVLDNLLNSGRISQSTYESFNKEIDEAIAEIERQQENLLEKMNSKMGELEQHVKTLEMLLANFEIQHVAGEVDEEVYQREIDLLSMGLETARRELDVIREAMNQLSSGMHIPTTEVVMPQEMEPQPAESVEASPQLEVEVTEETIPVVESEETPEESVEQNLPEPPVESVEGGETDSFRSPQEAQEEPQENPQETSQNPEETQLIETEAEGEERQEA